MPRPQLDAVREGLRDSVRYGMAHNADVPGMEIAGKTGTASDRPGRAMDGLPAVAHLGHEEVVIVIYLPRGNGADAARLAQHFFLAAKAPPAPESARSLTVELWATRSVTHLTATPLRRRKQARYRWNGRTDGLRISPGKTRKAALS